MLTEGVKLDKKRLADWTKFYKEVFGLGVDLEQVKLPSEREGFGWIIVVFVGLTMTQVFNLCRKRFTCGVRKSYQNPVRSVPQNRREPVVTYAVRVRDQAEADRENRGKNARTASMEGIKGVTLLERMLLELWFDWKYYAHLDRESFTLCTGSRDREGFFLRVNCPEGRLFCVGGVDPVTAGECCGVREILEVE